MAAQGGWRGVAGPGGSDVFAPPACIGPAMPATIARMTSASTGSTSAGPNPACRASPVPQAVAAKASENMAWVTFIKWRPLAASRALISTLEVMSSSATDAPMASIASPSDSTSPANSGNSTARLPSPPATGNTKRPSARPMRGASAMAAMPPAAAINNASPKAPSEAPTMVLISGINPATPPHSTPTAARPTAGARDRVRADRMDIGKTCVNVWAGQPAQPRHGARKIQA